MKKTKDAPPKPLTSTVPNQSTSAPSAQPKVAPKSVKSKPAKKSTQAAVMFTQYKRGMIKKLMIGKAIGVQLN